MRGNLHGRRASEHQTKAHGDVTWTNLNSARPAEVWISDGAVDSAKVSSIKRVKRVGSILQPNAFREHEILDHGDVLTQVWRVAEITVVDGGVTQCVRRCRRKRHVRIVKPSGVRVVRVKVRPI